MEYILIHTPNNNFTPEMMPAIIEMGKKIGANPEAMVPGGKLLASYGGRTKMIIVCLWEAPSTDAMMPALEQMSMLGWDTEIIPAERMDVRIEKVAKAMEAMKAGR